MFYIEFMRMFFSLLSREYTEEKGHEANTEICVGDPVEIHRRSLRTEELFPSTFFYLVTCALVVSFVMHYKPFRRSGYTELVYDDANSEEWPA